jgi:hypothetical protein
MPSDDSEVASLLETLNQSGFAIDFLPQISINTASKVLDDGSIENMKENTEEVYQIVQLKAECATPEQPASPVSTTPTSLITTRSSQRLMKKKDTKWSRNEGVTLKKNTKKGTNLTRRTNTLKRKRSLDDDDYSNYNSSESDSIDFNKNISGRSCSKKFVTKHNDNSVDFESDDHIYYDDDEDDEVNENDYFHSDDDENEKDFKNYVRDYNMANGGQRAIQQRNDPNKKESNKEAATRYRLKKLSEKERLFQTRMCLENENNEVKRKIEMASTEINYLKSLLVQMLLTKGMIDSKI